MKLTTAERRLISGLTFVTRPGVPIHWLKPSYRKIACKLVQRKLLKHFGGAVKDTAAGRKAARI